MPTLSGVYATLGGDCLVADKTRPGLTLVRQSPFGVPRTDQRDACRLRANADFWLCHDDGKIGKFGNPVKVVFVEDGKQFYIWVEPRGFDGNRPEYGLIPISTDQEIYSNRFLGVDKNTGRLISQDSWDEAAKFLCYESPNAPAADLQQ